mgnify:CR=1 FL=1
MGVGFCPEFGCRALPAQCIWQGSGFAADQTNAMLLLRQLKGIGSNINRLTVLANMGKVQVIGLEKAAGELSEVSAALRAVMEGR